MIRLKEILSEIEKNRAEEVHLFSNFQKRYKERDYAKASELLWGSVSKATFSIALLHGMRLGRHRELMQFIRNLARARTETHILEWISAAESLHSNFYHNWMEEEVFEENVEKVLNLRIWLLKTLQEELEETKRSSTL